MPAGSQGAGLRLAVTDDASGYQIRIIEDSAISVRKRITEFTAFIDRSRSLRRGVARDAAMKGELAKQILQTFDIL